MVCGCLMAQGHLQLFRADQVVLHLLSPPRKGITRAEQRTPRTGNVFVPCKCRQNNATLTRILLLRYRPAPYCKSTMTSCKFIDRRGNVESDMACEASRSAPSVELRCLKFPFLSLDLRSDRGPLMPLSCRLSVDSTVTHPYV